MTENRQHAKLARMFCRYSLRTTDLAAGRRFYAEAIGLALPDSTEGTDAASSLEGWPLHEQARARGVPAHWLGHIAVDDAEAAASQLVQLGGERLGPSVRIDEHRRYATVRDPFGAVIALRQGDPPAPADSRGPATWHQLHTHDAEGATRLYGQLFSWLHTGTIDLQDTAGEQRLFAFRTGREPDGAIANTARLPGVHVHWMFCFPVDDVDTAVARVRALGGTAFDPVSLPGPALRLSGCEDPQGAAFGLVSAVGR